jgi:hypothetical protein
MWKHHQPSLTENSHQSIVSLKWCYVEAPLEHEQMPSTAPALSDD